MSEELSREQVMTRRFELDSMIAVIAGKHKAELEPLQSELAMCEQFMKQTMNESGEQSVKMADGNQCFFTTKDSVKVADGEAFFAFVKKEDAFHLLNNAANKTAVKEFITENKAPPPGVEYVSFKDLAWRRGKGS